METTGEERLTGSRVFAWDVEVRRGGHVPLTQCYDPENTEVLDKYDEVSDIVKNFSPAPTSP